MSDDSFMDFLNDDSDFSLPEGDDLNLDALLSDLNLKQTDEFQDEGFSLEDLEIEFPEISEPKEDRKATTPVPPKNNRIKKSKAESVARPKPRKEKSEELPPSKFWNAIARHRTLINTCLIVTAVLLLGSIVGLIFLQKNADPYDGRIVANVTVAGVNLGGMTQEEAAQALRSTVASEYADTNMIVSLGNRQIILSPANTHAKLDVEAAVAAAYEYGRTGSPADRQKAFHDALTTPVNIDLVSCLGLDDIYIRSMVKDATAKIGGEFTQSEYTLEGTRPPLDADTFDSSIPCQTLIFSVGTPGSNANVDGIIQEILDAYTQKNFNMVVSAENLPDMPDAFDLDAILKEVSVDPVEAFENPVTKEVTVGSCGYTFSVEEAAAQLENAEYGTTVTIAMEYVKPSVLDIRGDYPEVLATYTTPISDDEAYNKNMVLLCKALDGTVLEPGAVFSFNKDLPARTAANGFTEAPAHAQYCLNTEVGGGADQVATTLFVSAMCANLNITQHSPGDHVCGYCENGTEVGVSASWKDLKIANTSNESVIIRAKVTETSVFIRILGKTALQYPARIDSKVSFTGQYGRKVVEKKASDGFTDGQVLVEGLSGGAYRLFRVEYDKETDKIISEKYLRYVEVPSVSEVTVKIR